MLLFIISVTFLPASVLGCAATAAVSTPATAAAAACTTCGNVQVVMNADAAGGEVNPPITQTAGTNAAGCRTITVTCANPGGTQTFFFWEEDGANRGTSTDNAATVTRVLTCNSNAELVLSEPQGGTGVVNTVECLAAA